MEHYAKKLRGVFLAVVMTSFALFNSVSAADVFVYWLDTSGSMRTHGFEEAKGILTEEVEVARPGDVLYVGTFDISDHLVGRVAVGEDGSSEVKEELVSKINNLAATGRWTNLDLPVKSGKAMLLEERAAGARKIVILSDGLSDPAPGFEKIDLQKIAEMVPQTLGFSVYLIGLPEDIDGLFRVPPTEHGVVSIPEAPHIKGIGLDNFTREQIEEGIKVVKDDPPLVPVEPTPPSLPDDSSTPETESACTSSVTEDEHESLPAPTPALSLEKPVERSRATFPFLWFLASGAFLLIIGGVTLGMRNGNTIPRELALEINEQRHEPKVVTLLFGPKTKKTVGPAGDVPLSGEGLPPVVLTLLRKKEDFWLIPQDTIALNGKLLSAKALLNPLDLVTVRDCATLVVHENDDNQKGA